MENYNGISFGRAMILLEERKEDTLYFKSRQNSILPISKCNRNLNELPESEFYERETIHDEEPEYPDESKRVFRIDENIFGTVFINYDPEKFEIIYDASNKTQIVLRPIND